VKLDITSARGLAGVRRRLHVPTAMGEDDEYGIETVQDVSEILAVAAEQYKVTEGQRFDTEGVRGQHVGLVPMIEYSRMRQQALRECPDGGADVRLGQLIHEWLEINSDFKTFRGTWTPERE